MMTQFLWKGIIRDKRRSLLPCIVVAIGVFFLVFLHGLIGGMENNMISMTANFETGHLKIMTRAYSENEEQKPLDLALLDIDLLLSDLKKEYPEVDWNPRISFGGLLDIPDSTGETLAQGPVSGMAYNLLSAESHEAKRMGLEKALVSGRLIRRPMEVLISADFAERFKVQPEDTLTFFGSTMYGSMTFTNLSVAGIVRFGTAALDRGAIILDLQDARQLLDMENAASEVLGFLPQELYNDKQAESIKTAFNNRHKDSMDEYAPVMLQLADQNFMREMLDYTSSVTTIMIFLLILVLSIVLWNTGILGGIRRYNEFGVRLALGEEKKHIYRSLLTESFFIGIIGSSIGTLLGLCLSFYISKYGIDYGPMMENISMMIDPVIRSQITPAMYVIGFIPGVLSMLTGTALAGIGIYKRKTATLFKELEG